MNNNNTSNSNSSTSSSRNNVRLYGSALVECGYCKGARAAYVDKERAASSQAYSILADSLEASLYEDFLCAGWRRSGNALYKPDNFESCCPALTIRLPVERFSPSKSQRKVARQMKRLLEGSCERVPSAKGESSSVRSSSAPSALEPPASPSVPPASQIIQEAGILDTLQEWTRALLLEIIPQEPYTSTLNTISSIPILFKVQPPRKKKAVTDESTSVPVPGTVTVYVYTSVCAGIAGQSKGRIDRTDLSARLAQALAAAVSTTDTTTDTATTTKNTTVPNNAVESHPKKHRTEPLANPASAAATTSAVSDDRTITIHSVQVHAASGQVLVELHVPVVAPPTITATATTTTAGSSPMDMTDHNHTNHQKGDRLVDWWLSVRKNQQNQQQPPRPLPRPPYDLTVDTLPAHESVMDPAVHQLYCLYQHKVHGDADPHAATTCAVPDIDAHAHADADGGVRDDTNSHGTAADDDDDDDDDGKGSAFDSNKWAGRAPVGWLDSTREMLKREYQHLPAKQQRRITKSFVSFYEFLVENPFRIMQEDERSAAWNQGTTNSSKVPPPGTYHQHYRLSDGVLIAVGVVDVLPHGLSSVYLFYDPTFAHDLVPLGKYAILREIEWTQQAGLPYYYLGYYIESCPKMRYKADYHPSELLCPTTYQWVNAEEAKETILRESPDRHCCTLNKKGSSNSSSTSGRPDVDITASAVEQVRMEVGIDTPVTIRMLQPPGQTLVRPYLEEFVKKAGREISLKCIVNFR
jgi:arginine-tRNA-protein transferase